MNLRECQSISTRLDNLLEDRQNDIQQLFSSIDSDFRFYLGSLNKVQRWQYHQFQKNIDNLPLVDTDFSHVSRMLQIKNQIQNIAISNINYDDVELMILFHDGGEIITGDICQNDPLRNQKEFMKDIEIRSFPLLILRQLKKENIPLRTKFSKIYQRYNNRGQNIPDSESQLVKLIDHFDGNSFGMKYVYSRDLLSRYYPDGNLPIDPDILVRKIIETELCQLELFINTLSSSEDKQKFIRYYKDTWFKNYLEYGYREMCKPYLEYLDKLLQ